MATWGNFVLDKGFNAAVALTKFRLVKGMAATPETVTPVTGIADDVIGVPQFTVLGTEILRGKGASVRVIGVSETEASGAIPLWSRCQLEADGRVKVLVGGSGARFVGICVGGAAVNAGDRIAMLIIQGGALA